MAEDAKGVLALALDQYGLGSLADWAWARYLQGVSVEQIMLEVRDTPAYKTRYPAMAELSRQGRAITETDYRNYEENVRSQAQAWGIPKGMYDTPDSVAKMLVNGVSAAEVNQRFQMAAVGAYTAPEEVKQAYRDLYGLSGGDLIATYLDPDKALPLLQAKAAAAQVAGAAATEHMAIGVSEAERLASQGVDFAQAQRGYGQAKVIEGLDYAAGLSTNRDQRVAAQFGDVAAQQKVQQAEAARLAVFQGGGGLAAGQEGIAGLSRGTA